MSNLLRTDDGLLWNDLEDVCVGPVHWDVAGLMLDAVARDGSGVFLRAYGGPPLDELKEFITAHRLYATVWQAFKSHRSHAGGR